MTTHALDSAFRIADRMAMLYQGSLIAVGTPAEAQAPIAVVESVKAASDIYAPVKGTVVEANDALTNNPALINTDPFGQGWIFALKIDNADDLKNLQSAQAYKDQIG